MLERSAGMQLLDRPGGRRAVTPTEAGSGSSATRGARQLQCARPKPTCGRSPRARPAHSGWGRFQSVGVRMIPPAMRLYVKRRPAIQVRLIEAHHSF